MADQPASLYLETIPHRLFFSALPDGALEFSCFVRLPAQNTSSAVPSWRQPPVAWRGRSTGIPISPVSAPTPMMSTITWKIGSAQPAITSRSTMAMGSIPALRISGETRSQCASSRRWKPVRSSGRWAIPGSVPDLICMCTSWIVMICSQHRRYPLRYAQKDTSTPHMPAKSSRSSTQSSAG